MIRRLLVLLWVMAIALLVPFIASPPVVSAQEATYPPITPANAAQLSLAERLGSGTARSVAWSPDGAWLAVASTIGVWVYAGDSLTSPPTLLELPAGASSVAVSSAHIAAGSDDGTLHVWDAATLEPLAAFESHLYAVSALAFSADGSRLSSGDHSGVVRLWNMTTLTELATFESLGQPYESPDELAFSAVGALARIGYCDSIEVIAPDSSSTRQPLPGFMCPLQAVAFNGDAVLAYSDTGATYTWDVTAQTVQQQPTNPPLPENTPVQAASPDGALIAVGGNDGLVRLQDAATGVERARLFGHLRGVTAVAFSPDSRLVVSGSLDRTLHVWDVAAALADPNALPLVALTGHTSGVTALAFRDDGALLASAGYDGTVRLWGVN